jgi:hypothetical protein
MDGRPCAQAHTRRHRFLDSTIYGDHIPRTLTDRTPIADAAALRRNLTRARRLAHPFYAGLPAYGYALLYSPRGSLIALRGDIPPALVARDPRLQLVKRESVGATDAPATTTTPNSSSTPDSASTPTAWRYDFLATADAAISGLNIRTGEHLLLEIPTAAGLRLMAQLTRQHGGTHLRGICLFRLPTATDPATLTAREIAHALADRTAQTEATLELSRIAPDETEQQPHQSAAQRTRDHAQTFALTAHNPGAAAATVGDGAFNITIRIPAGSLRHTPALEGFTKVETLCGSANTLTPRGAPTFLPADTLQPCSPRRANALRLSAPTWAAGETARATLIFSDTLPPHVAVETTLSTDTGQQLRRAATIHTSHD